jgi:hypothetical protein
VVEGRRRRLVGIQLHGVGGAAGRVGGLEAAVRLVSCGAAD